jgi:predicted nucleotidyltransferase component of viral defense system
MLSSGKDYRKLYQLQDKFLQWWPQLGLPFYLTGGTALGRYYLKHRYSEDLDFFVNADPHFPDYLSTIRKEISKSFQVSIGESLFTSDFARFYIEDESVYLKIEFVNEVDFRAGKPKKIYFGLIDTPLNIMSNKLSALSSRDEPKDVFDIMHIALNYSFNWIEIFNDAKHKAVINEIDVEQRLIEFPVQTFHSISFLENQPDMNRYPKLLETIANDFLLGSDNSLGAGKPSLKEARPVPDLTRQMK